VYGVEASIKEVLPPVHPKEFLKGVRMPLSMSGATAPGGKMVIEFLLYMRHPDAASYWLSTSTSSVKCS
jgi:hypothetical protein